MRPGSGLVVLPREKNALWWLPCLTREEGGTREHCWFLAPTDLPSLFCRTCRLQQRRTA